MSNAALYLHPDAYDTSRPQLMGRHSAGESFLRGLLRHAEVDAFQFWNVAGRPTAELDQLVQRIETTDKPVRWLSARSQLPQVGVAHMPTPEIGVEAWHRRPFGERAYALSGITHTTATHTVMQAVGDLLIAPLHDYDALICTSQAVRDSLRIQLDDVREHLQSLYGARRRPEPMLATIPLGVNVSDFAPSAEHRRYWRERLQIPEDGVVALFVGRFSPGGKMNPALMALALERAARASRVPIYWVNAGWALSDQNTTSYTEETRKLCPTVHYRAVDGRPPDVRFSIWSVADFFISFSDNIQETFGLTPVEAMAAGLPCVVTDWDGYRDTVRNGEDGFRIATVAPAPGEGSDLAYAYSTRALSYEEYVAAAGQVMAIDLAGAQSAIVALATNPDLRARMGAQAQARAHQVFDWSAIVPQYQALWAEQDARRRAAPAVGHRRDNPFRPDPFRLFAGYPTRTLAETWRVAAAQGIAWADAQALLTSPLASYGGYQRCTLQEAEAVFVALSSGGPRTVAELLEAFPEDRRGIVRRSLLWLARFGVLALNPQA